MLGYKQQFIKNNLAKIYKIFIFSILFTLKYNMVSWYAYSKRNSNKI